VGDNEYFEFRPKNGPKWTWVISRLQETEVQRINDGIYEIFREPDSCMFEFYRVFDGLRTPPNPITCRDGFIPLNQIKKYNNSAALREVFPDFLSGRIVYEDASGAFICRTIEGKYVWLVDGVSLCVADSFAGLLSKFIDGFCRDGRGIVPYP
jgi:hypothetical protein